MVAAQETVSRSSAPRARADGPDERRDRRPLMVMALLTVPLIAYALLPDSEVRQVLYPVIGLLCISVAFWGLLRSGQPPPPGWLLVIRRLPRLGAR